MSKQVGLRGKTWFQALTSVNSPMGGDPGSVLTADARLGEDTARFLCVVPDPKARFPCVRRGEVGLEEAYTLATRVSEVIDHSENVKKRPIVAIVDVKSQAYGRREETAAIFLAAATAADAYASARMKGHPVIALIVGHAFSGGFLTHGYQANRILAFDDDDIVIHAMHKEAAARITLRSVADLDRLGHEVPPMSYDVRDYAKLGLLHKLLHIQDPDTPAPATVAQIQKELIDAIADARAGSTDLRNRLESKGAREMRKAGLAARAYMEKQWSGD
ncbi:biotin-independent malonate decarboxylase subunit gamma [Granulicella sp. L60]|uniref:biotin-independent malonate decarboxylase subunit gamma n=1 Tax=Granulicella sp. L60 TaxID=1641866 RepID=UPI00131C0961|nr:biotin-independent malonate decarboxylase subunit gamma [Granulicella sp. L60]